MSYDAALYALVADNCGHCAATKPHLRSFAAKHPEVYVETYELLTGKRQHYVPDGSTAEIGTTPWPEGFGWEVEATPTLVLVRRGVPPIAIDGYATMTRLERFYSYGEGSKAPRARRSRKAR